MTSNRRRTNYWRVPEGNSEPWEFGEDAAFAYLKFIYSKRQTRDTLSRMAKAMDDHPSSTGFFRIIENLLLHAVRGVNLDDWERRFKAEREAQRIRNIEYVTQWDEEKRAERSARARHAALARHRGAKKNAA